jgi:hypothetical protein
MCKVTASAIQQDAKAVATAVLSIATALEPTNPTLAAQLTEDADALTAATANWTTGSAVADINDAAQVIETAMALIPQTAAYAPFVAIAVAALDILIANLSTQSTQSSTTPVANAKALLKHVDSLPPNPWRGKAQINVHEHGIRPAFEKAWNGAVDANSTLGFQKITI